MSSVFDFRKINDIIITPIKVKSHTPEEILGYNCIAQYDSTILIAGKKGSGKTNTLFKIIEECTTSKTIFIVFSSTHNSDKNWKVIKAWLAKRGNPTEFYTSIVDVKSSNLKDLITRFQIEDAEKAKADLVKNENKPVKVPDPFGLFDHIDGEIKSKPRQKKKSPPYFIIFDDISNELRKGKDVQELLKHMRHYGCKIVICTQFVNDIDPPSRAQVDFWLIFKGFGAERIEEIFPQLELSDLDFPQFWNVYKEVTKKPHDFLFIDRNTGELRRNFSERLIHK